MSVYGKTYSLWHVVFLSGISRTISLNLARFILGGADMSSYYNANSKKKFDINDFGLPPFATRYLGYLSIEKNSAPRSVYNYALSVRTFLRWVRER